MEKFRLFAEFVMIWWKFCQTVSGQTVCSEYLVSGLYGVENSAISASSIWTSNRNVCGPQNSRLHFNGTRTGVASSWCAGTLDDQQHIQVRLPRETVVGAVMIKGRQEEELYQYVETYYLLYSMDGITWSYVTSEIQQPKLFTGNNGSNTVVKSSLVPSITAVYLRINPRSFHHYISLQFDVSGCYKVEETGRRSEFYRVPMLSSQVYKQNIIFETPSSSLPECGKQCHKDKRCISFSFDMSQRNCSGYPSVPAIHTAFSAGLTPFFVKKGIFTSLGYRQIKKGGLIYRVNEVSLNQTSASEMCIQQHSQLVRIDSKSDMLSLQTIVAGNTILAKYHFQLFVSGMYMSNQWQYSDGEIINSALWSPGNPDPSQGHCVVLTRNGLTSEKCSERLFSLCGWF
ncbi:hemocytin-like [Ylistrum balloti]|uniref:hemocytin-like n=1 Tax=Ylistrum balloti TaxID=509963 RepID=UPI0029059F06|nr:hemocytin-like [Ylistrum balloti]